jgi:hypothetical protein
METEHQLLREIRSEISELEKDFNSRLRGMLIRIATELGEVKPGPPDTTFISQYLPTSRKKIKCGKL